MINTQDLGIIACSWPLGPYLLENATVENVSQNQFQIEQLREESLRFQAISDQVAKVIVGQQDIITFITIAILCDGHILLEGMPGVAKTTMVKAVTRSLGLNYNRIQFTPDLLPADLTGTLIYNQQTGSFETRKGPVFTNLLLADEINRAPAKVQAALLEAMQERQITIGSTTFSLEPPFLVFATQNPIEQEGTYRLPEAQIDRFMFKLLVDYPTRKQEEEIVRRSSNVHAIHSVITKQDLVNAKSLIEKVYVDDRIVSYIVSLIFATREPSTIGLHRIEPYIQYGVSPRATLTLYHAARAHALIKGRHFVTPDDVKSVAVASLRHRLVLTYQAEADGIKADTIIETILNTVQTP